MAESRYAQKKELAAILVGVGHKKKDVAAMLGVAAQTISNWAKDKAWQQICSQASEDIIAALKEKGAAAAGLAFGVQVDALGWDDKRLSLSAAQDLLDRFGLPRGMKQEISGPDEKAVEVKHVIDAKGSAEVLSILAEIGAIPSPAEGGGDPEADEIRSAPADA